MTENYNDREKPSNNYETGYGKPPKNNQFRKGVSGNPRGRPRRKSEAIDVVSIIDQPIIAKIGNKTQEMHPFEAGIRQLVKKALQEKNVRSLIELLKKFEAHGLFKQPEVYRGGGVIHAPKGITPEDWVNSYGEIKG